MQTLSMQTWRITGVTIVLGGLVLGWGAVPSEQAPEVKLDVSLGTPSMLAGKKQNAFLKVGLTGFDLPSSAKRSPVNLALVLDRSSSMAGEKIEKAREAASMILDRLGSDDVVSLISYDSYVQVISPAAPLTDKEEIRRRIRALSPGGSTALFAGVSKGIEEA